MNDTFSHVISGGRDKKIIMTELKNPQRYTLICEENAPILKMILTPDQSSIWVATSASTINNYVILFFYVVYNVIMVYGRICNKDAFKKATGKT